MFIVDLLSTPIRLTSPITLDNRISLKYWLDDPFWTRTSSLDLSRDWLSLAGCTENIASLLLVTGLPGLDRLALCSTFASARDLSRLKIRDAISAMMVFFVRRIRGPDAG